jgi:HEAT repeat protein
MDTETKTQVEREAKGLSSSDPRERLQAVRNLSRIAIGLPFNDREDIARELEQVAIDPEPFIRWNVAISLGQIAHPIGVAILEKMVADTHANVRWRVALALGLMGEKSSLAILERMIDDQYKIGEHAVVRAYVAIALGKLGYKEGVPLMARLVKDSDPVVRWHVVVALGDIGDESGIEHLTQLVQDPIPFVRGHTAIALAQIGQAEGLSALETVTRYTSKQAEETGNAAEKRMAQVCTEALATLRAIIASSPI